MTTGRSRIRLIRIKFGPRQVKNKEDNRKMNQFLTERFYFLLSNLDESLFNTAVRYDAKIEN